MAFAANFEARVAPSVTAYSRTSEQLGDSRIRIFSGNRIVRNGDDAASLSEATNLQSQVSTLRSALVGGARATSFLQVAADGLANIRTLLETLDGLVAQATRTGNTRLSYATLDAQFQSGLRAIDAVVAATTFNGASILDGSASGAGAPTAQIGEDTSETITLSIANVSSASLFPASPNLSSAAAASTATSSVTTAQDVVDTAIATIDALQARIDSANASVKQDIFGVTQGIDTRLATDIDAETRSLNRTSLQQQTAALLLAQALGVNSGLLGLLSAGTRA